MFGLVAAFVFHSRGTAGQIEWHIGIINIQISSLRLRLAMHFFFGKCSLKNRQ